MLIFYGICFQVPYVLPGINIETNNKPVWVIATRPTIDLLYPNEIMAPRSSFGLFDTSTSYRYVPGLADSRNASLLISVATR